ncbi:nucleotidyltransferase family protein [Patescibacteria group bacterium]|nr:nucleotidyltransferase family protein [Patescibacteria group bacterium]
MLDLSVIKKTVEKVVAQQRFARNIKSVSVFGSVARGEANEESDIDLIVEFEKPVGLFSLAGLKNSFEDEFQKKVDLLTPKSIHPFLKEKILSSAQKIYER